MEITEVPEMEVMDPEVILLTAVDIRGYTAGSSKTGESRPFKMMAGLSILGTLLLGTGILVFRRSKNGKREKHL